MPSQVLKHAPATPPELEAYFARKLKFETDCWDVHEAYELGEVDFVLLDARNSTAFAGGHVPGAISIPHRQMTPESLAKWPMDTVFVTYCAGPHCNAADQAALKLARLGRPCKVMMGGVTGWIDEGFTLAS
jgi:rhodanese-related sulfurtransferase